MKKTIILICCLLLCTQMPKANNSDYEHLKDSFLRVMRTQEGEKRFTTYINYVGLISYYETEVDTIIHHYNVIIQDADEKSKDKLGCTARSNILSILYNHNAHDIIIEKAPAYLEFMAVKENWSCYFKSYNHYIMAYINLKQMDKAIEEAQLFYQKTKDLDHPENAYPLMTLGMVYRYIDREAEGLDYLKQALKKVNHYKEVTPFKTVLYPRLIEAILESFEDNADNTEYSEITEYMKRWEADIETVAAIDPNKKPALSANFNLASTKLALAQKDYNKAEYYCDLIENHGNSTLYDIYAARRKIAFGRKDWKEALKYAEMLYELNRGDLQNSYSLATQKAIILFHLHETEKGIQALDESYAILDSIHKKEVHAKIDELHTIYKVDILTTEKERNRQFFIFAAIACVLLIIALTIYIIYSNKLKAKNRSLYNQIQESIRRDKQAEQALAAVPAETLTRETELYRRLNELMQSERLFVQSELDRKTLADRLGTNEKYLADAIRQECNETVSAYIARLRLQYALELLETRPELTLEAVATESGHASYSPFFRAFGKMYGMSPSEYRRLATKN